MDSNFWFPRAGAWEPEKLVYNDEHRRVERETILGRTHQFAPTDPKYVWVRIRAMKKSSGKHENVHLMHEFVGYLSLVHHLKYLTPSVDFLFLESHILVNHVLA